MIFFKLFSSTLFLTALIVGSSCGTSQKMSTLPPLSTPTLRDSFPFDWFGSWVGTLEILNTRGISQKVPMKIEISATEKEDVYRWAITYGEDPKEGLRPYLLRTLNAAKGLYQVDEQNNIKMESYLLGNKLFCAYSVQGNSMIVTEEKKGEELLFEIIFWKDKFVSETGGGKINNEEIPKVKTFPVVVSQRATLRREKKS